MARSRDPKGKIARRFGINIFGNPKFDRLIERKPHGPGKSPGDRVKKKSVYALQLIEKQKVKLMYGVLEKQFRRYFKIASTKNGITGENLISILESRLDNIVYRMRFGVSRSQARQIVLHKHILVNDQVVNIPSYSVKPGDVITVVEKSKKNKMILEALKLVGTAGTAPWVDVDVDNCQGTFKEVPRRNEIPDLVNINEQLIVELYSK